MFVKHDLGLAHKAYRSNAELGNGIDIDESYWIKKVFYILVSFPRMFFYICCAKGYYIAVLYEIINKINFYF